MAELRTERDRLAALDPVTLREALAAAEARGATPRSSSGRRTRPSPRRAPRARRPRTQERAAADAEARTNKAWRDASTELERLREKYEEDDRFRGDVERRINEAERLLREGFGAEPEDVVAAAHGGRLGRVDRDGSRSWSQRRLALLGRVNLLAAGELESMQERHDFMQRELDDVRKARRDLLEVIPQIDREITETFTTAYRDVAVQFERLVRRAVPRRRGTPDPRRIRSTRSSPASRSRPRPAASASSASRCCRAASDRSPRSRSCSRSSRRGPSPFYLMDEVEPALDDVNLHRFLRLVRAASQRPRRC